MLNEFDNNLFFRTDINIYTENPKHIIGIKTLSYYSHLVNNKQNWSTELFFGIKHIYIFHDIATTNKNTLLNYVHVPNYISNSNIPITYIKIDLNNFLKLYPEFKDDKFDDFYKYYSYANSLNGEIYEKSCKCNNLDGSTNILENLIIGQSFDFDRFPHVDSDEIKFNKYCVDTISALKSNGVNSIINVYKSQNKLYPPKIIKLLSDQNIEVFSFPLDEETINSNENTNNFLLATEKLYEQIKLGKKIYLHCHVGKNRSISVALLYLVKYLKIPLKIACEEIYLKKTFAPQIKFIKEIWNEAIKTESNPIALCKIISDVEHVGNTYSLFGLGFYDVHKLDVMSGKKTLQLINDYNKIKQYITQNNNNT